MSDVLWLPSSNLGALHAVPPMAEVFERPVLKTRGTYKAMRAVCGREIEWGMAKVLGQSPPKCKHCLRRLGYVPKEET